jgi:hypothetical protein
MRAIRKAEDDVFEFFDRNARLVTGGAPRFESFFEKEGARVLTSWDEFHAMTGVRGVRAQVH